MCIYMFLLNIYLRDLVITEYNRIFYTRMEWLELPFRMNTLKVMCWEDRMWDTDGKRLVRKL